MSDRELAEQAATYAQAIMDRDEQIAKLSAALDMVSGLMAELLSYESAGSRYLWLRDHALQTLVPGPVVCAADKWGAIQTQDGEPVLLSGEKLDAAIAEARALAAARGEGSLGR